MGHPHVQNCIANDLNPLSPSAVNAAQSAIDSASQASLAGAAAYSVANGLTVPLCSSIVRAGVTGAETLGKVSGILTMGSVVYALGDAVVAEYKQCQ